jgi:hypothetical protein
MPGVEPRDLFGQHGGWSQRKQQRARCRPAARGVVEDEGRDLQRVREVARKPAVVLARHDAVEAELEGEGRLLAELTDDVSGLELVVRVQPDRDRAGAKTGAGVTPPRFARPRPAMVPATGDATGGS